MKKEENLKPLESGKDSAKFDEKPEFKGRKGRGRRYSSSSRSARSPRSGNDFSYWNGFPVLLEDAVKFPWYFIPGMQVDSPLGAGFAKTSLLVLHYAGTPGVCIDSTSPFNLQMRNTWLEMHRKYRGIGSYQFSDFGMACFAIIDIYEMIAELEFIYGMFHAYPINNRHLPLAVLTKIGYSAQLLSDVQVDLANFRYSINKLIIKSKALCLPKGLPALYNRIGMAGFIYSDANNARCSLVRFQPRVHYKWNATAVQTGSALFAHQGLPEASATENKVDKIIAYVESFIDALITDDDINRMCSDLLACYGDGGVDTLAPLVEDYSVLPVYSQVMLNKIHNAEFALQMCTSSGAGAQMSGVATAASTAAIASDVAAYFASASNLPTVNTILGTTASIRMAVTQNDNTVIFKPYITRLGLSPTTRAINSSIDHFYYTVDTTFAGMTYSPKISSQHVCDTWEDVPSSETRCDALLFKINSAYLSIVGTNPNFSTEVRTITSCGPEMLLWCDVHSLDTTQAAYFLGVNTTLNFTTTLLDLVSKCDWHPLVLINEYGSDRMFGDVDNVTSVSDSIVMKVQDAALLSAFRFSAGSKGSSAE